jgi:hydroxymethylpyrimidine pyrophosphatase-like HAD family hydrolase
MPFYFRAIAIDYDGTLSEQPRATAEVLDAVRAVRDTGRRCVLVTGRILAELRADFPDVREHFDAIVAENGAVLIGPGDTNLRLAAPVSESLASRLGSRGVPYRRGQVLLATEAAFDDEAYDAIRSLGLDLQLVRNRHALMVLPAGVTKGTGVARALAALNLSMHNAIGIGDAENDHALLDACEIGIAVRNAIEPLKAHADLVLAEPNGAGVAAFLRRLARHDVLAIEPRRHRIALGTYDDGTPAMIPASRVNIALYGPSGSGKSHVAGLLAEQLLAQDYTLCVLDLEGDHTGLGVLHGVVTLGGQSPLPPMNDVVQLLTGGLGSVVVDLSLEADDEKRAYATGLLHALRRARAESGLPHWIFVDEAHVPLHASGNGWWCQDAEETGLCVITYRPELICEHVRRRVDICITLDEERRAFVLRAGAAARREFAPAARTIGHIRHWHKYSAGQLPVERHFVFRDRSGPVGTSAGNLEEFVSALAHVPRSVLRHHAGHGDFSRWLGDLSRRPAVREAVREVERAMTAERPPHETAALRARLQDAVRSHAMH